ncbi:uncharacterized protein LOC144451027 [Glandiceps talaboti]
MIASLVDLCLKHIGDHLKELHQQVRKYLPVVFKEELLSRLAEKSMFTVDYLPYIEASLMVPELKNLQFIGCTGITDEILRHIASKGCQLHCIDIQNEANFNPLQGNCLTQEGVANLVCGQHKLETLILKQDFTKGDYKWLESIQTDYLKTLSLDITVRSKNLECLQYLRRCLESATALQSLSLDFSNYVNCNNVLEVINGDLYSLQIKGCVVNEETFRLLGTFRHIKTLSLSCSSLTRCFDDSISQMLSTKCVHLQELRIASCGGTVSPSVTFPSNLVKLSLTDPGWSAEYLGNLTKLNSLRLSTNNFNHNKDAVRAILPAILSNLEEFLLFGERRSSDLGVETFIVQAMAENCEVLKKLHMSYRHEETVPYLLRFFQSGTCQHLTELRLCNYTSSNNHPSTVQRYRTLHTRIAESCKNIIDLDVVDPYIDQTFIQAIANNCQNLKRLQLCSGRLGNSTSLTIHDDDIISIANKCPLEKLVIMVDNNLTERAILTFTNKCPLLKELSLATSGPIPVNALQIMRDNSVRRVKISELQYTVF